MIVSWNWLADFLRLDMPVSELTERLALTGLNHESTADVGGDLAIDLEVTSNRPDCLSHIGVAREIGVLFERPVRAHDPRPPASGAPVESRAGVRVEAPDLCPRFTARVVSGVTVGESPWWLRKRLETVGVRPISNVVDVTNYVMFECGQPLHAYDLDRLQGREIVVRRGHAGESLTAINNKAYELTPQMLVIADAGHPVGLAGVMGGLDTEIHAETTNVLIESARFDAMSVRRTARALGLFSPSSHRFERPLDPARTEWASRRCAELILELAGGTLHPGLIDVGDADPGRPPVTLRFDQIARVLGIEVPRDRAEAILSALGLETGERADDRQSFRPPSWRADLEREIDLIEEVARVHGYEHIPEDRPVPLAGSARGARERVEAEVRGALTGCGFDEAFTFSLVSEALGIPIGPGAATPPIRIEHSSRRRENTLRQSLVPSLLAARRHNEAHGDADAHLFEIAQVYLPRPGKPLPDEPTRLALVSGHDYLGLKGVVEALLGRLHIDRYLEVRPTSIPLFAPGRAAELSLAGVHLGYLGEVATDQLDAFELRASCAVAEISFDVLQAQGELVPVHRAMPPFPAVARDLSLVVPRSLAWSDLATTVTSVAGPTLESIHYLDTFRGDKLPEASQSVHFGMRFRHPERTLAGDEVERAVKAVIDACAERFDATLRA